ncbi:uroporphyrinogen-III synthase [Saprospira sp. CCB-QB6]|uniref:uroporphyrinogen-III synthase n=1 Tax=Saprospira sp. CCB-QB6 TaxID=3023936 RepID=UPI002349BD9D|nr:uroporphyrinogen-III synthase [Saprospira sp. CCB-QB6]WCL82944.1 uroporphyrinogen-III synthase [Saprospira sp. CCB-QB6]
MQKIFISRELTEQSDFRRLLAGKAEPIGYSLLEFQATAFGWPKDTDCYFFYSPRGLRYALSQWKKPWEQLPLLAALGPATAAVLQEFGLSADFIGSGRPAPTALAFKEWLDQKSVCFFRAEKSKRSIQQLLKGEILAKERIVYSNQPKIQFADSQADILVFTSPLNAETYLKAYPKRENQEILVIGRTTAQKLIEMGYNDFHLATAPKEEALAQYCLRYLL